MVLCVISIRKGEKKMIYHNECKAEDAREFGWPLVCDQRWSDGTLDYHCPACGECYSFHEDDSDLPDGLIERG
jgi:hypothetical protein